jgi:Icc protein
MTTILQISDPHIAPAGSRVSARLDTTACLQRLLARIQSIRSQIGPIDAIFVTGDLSEDGSAESYAQFKDLITCLKLPIFVLPGNHDSRDGLRTAFEGDGYLPARGPLNWQRQIGAVQVIALDTLVEGQGGGRLVDETLTFLKTALHKAEGAPVLVGLHHPPFRSGISFMDKMGLENATDFAQILRQFQGELRVVCGHIHSMMVTGVGGHTAISAPAVCSTFAYDTRINAPSGFLVAEGGFLLHKWDEGFQTVQISPTPGSSPFPF